MMFQALLVSKDDDAAAVLTPVLSRAGVGLQGCGYPEALIRLSEQKFDAVIVDYDDPHSAALVLQNAYRSSSGNNTVTIALLSDKAKLRNVFGAGANFVLYKPISEEQVQASLRAVIALIKRERRRSYRVPIQVPLQLMVQNGAEMEGILLDLSEDGMDVLASQPLCPSASLAAHFTLPDGNTDLDLKGEVAWANPNGQSGVRFLDTPESVRETLRAWVASNAPDLPPDDPEPIAHSKLTDLSLGGCYVETESPFPEHSGILLYLRADQMEVQVEGIVRVMHPGFGMGIEFASRTATQREQVERFIGFLTSRPGTVPDLAIAPGALSAIENEPAADGPEDPLLDLLRSHESLSQEEFLQQLRRQRHSEEVSS